MRRFYYGEMALWLLLLLSPTLPFPAHADALSPSASKPPAAEPPKAAGRSAESETQKAQRARQKLDAFLEALQAKTGDVTPIRDEVLVRLFPRVSFFAVRYQLHPTPIAPPAPLRFANVIAVPDTTPTGPGGQFRILTDTDKLLTFFAAAIPPQKTAEGRMDTTHAWLRLSEDLAEDGPYAFSIPAVQVVPGKDAPGKVANQISAKAQVTSGGDGRIEVMLYFDGEGHITSVSSACSVARSRP